MELETIELRIKDQQALEFTGKEVARTSDNVYIIYESKKGHWVATRRAKAKSGGFTGYESQIEIIQNKNHEELFEFIGFGTELDQICNQLNINPAKKLDI